MASKKLKKIHPLWLIGLVLIVIGIFAYPTATGFLDWVYAEGRDYRLMDELHNTAKNLKQYKIENGSYPATLSSIRDSDKFCVSTLGKTKCTTILYKPSTDFQSFKLAADANPVAGTWVVTYYDPVYSMTQEEENQLPEEQRKFIRDKYGKICYLCFAYKPTEKEDLTDPRPIYKQDPKAFPNPEEWPDLP